MKPIPYNAQQADLASKRADKEVKTKGLSFYMMRVYDKIRNVSFRGGRAVACTFIPDVANNFPVEHAEGIERELLNSGFVVVRNYRQSDGALASIDIKWPFKE